MVREGLSDAVKFMERMEQLDDVSKPCRYLGENCSQNRKSQKVKGLRQE